MKHLLIWLVNPNVVGNELCCLLTTSVNPSGIPIHCPPGNRIWVSKTSSTKLMWPASVSYSNLIKHLNMADDMELNKYIWNQTHCYVQTRTHSFSLSLYTQTHTYTHTHKHSRFLWTDAPVSTPVPPRWGFETVLWELHSASLISELWVGEPCGTPVPHQRQLGLVLVL